MSNRPVNSSTSSFDRTALPGWPKRVYGKLRDALPIPNLIELQIRSYKEFLQQDVHPEQRDPGRGLEGILREAFPMDGGHDGKIKLEYLHHELSKPRYTPDECRRLRLTYGLPFKIKLRLTLADGEQRVEDVYLGEIPQMIGGGEFIINGAERVIVSQLHRSPGIDFLREWSTNKWLNSFWIIPERGSWIECNVSKKDILQIRIDQSTKLPATLLLRAMSESYSYNADIIRQFHKTEIVKLASKGAIKKLQDRLLVSELYDPEDPSNEKPVYAAGTEINDKLAEKLIASGLEKIEVTKETLATIDRLIFNTLSEDTARTQDEALVQIYQRLRPGNAVSIDKAKLLLHDKFYDESRYRLGKVGRFRINRKFKLFGKSPDGESQTLTPSDLLRALQYVLLMRNTKSYPDPSLLERFPFITRRVIKGGERDLQHEDLTKQVGETGQINVVGKDQEGEYDIINIDDIDHLGNRRVRTIVELAGDEFRKGLLKLRHTIKERMNTDMPEKLTPRLLINAKTISSAIEYFFGRGELSQVVDQTNPLAQLIHERRLSALGPGGLNRKRAGFEVRDVHISHYGRICPIETPEGANIGLISSLAVYATINDLGFLTTPYLVVTDGKIKKDKSGKAVIKYLDAYDEEAGAMFAPADTEVDPTTGALIPDAITGHVQARKGGDFLEVDPKKIEYLDVSPKQLVGVSASLIPFLEHNDANRALMGSNMQRQAVPLLITEPPIVATGMEVSVARNSGMVVVAEQKGIVTECTADRIVIDDRDVYKLRKFVGLNERTCLNQRPIVVKGQKVEAGQVIADGAATSNGELSLGKNVLVAFMTWDGYNFEDAVLINERLVSGDVYTSIHIDEFDCEIRETKLGAEEFTPDISSVGEKALRNLDETGIVRIGTLARPGDILVGKVAPKNKSELSPEEKLLHAIFGKAGEDMKNDSLVVPSGVDGTVIDTKKFSRKVQFNDDERAENEKKKKRAQEEFEERFHHMVRSLYDALTEAVGGPLKTPKVGKEAGKEIAFPKGADRTVEKLNELHQQLHLNNLDVPPSAKERVTNLLKKYNDEIQEAHDEIGKLVQRLERGDELPTGVLEMAKVYLSTKRKISVGDKIAGRHGNKGVIARILKAEDMPFLADGTPVDMMLNPLGVPSRMNVGQIFETHLGWAAGTLGFRAITPVFDGCKEGDLAKALAEAGLPADGKAELFDGRTGERFEQEVTVGYMYILKLHHLVDDKIHARATGPYSLITQQPLGGKARYGGQRFGEMEVWALEAYGAAHILQELLTVKSDDVDGRTKIYEAMVKGENTFSPGTPVSFEVLMNEIKGLALDIRLNKKSS